MPDLNILIKAMECERFCDACRNCPYGYGFEDESGDFPFWSCNEGKIMEDALVYLKIYQHLIEETKGNFNEKEKVEEENSRASIGEDGICAYVFK